MSAFAKIGSLIAICWSVFQLYTAGFGFFHVMIQRPVHLTLALALAFLTYPFRKNTGVADEDAPKGFEPGLLDFALAVVSLGTGLYLLLHSERIITRIYFVDKVFSADILIGILIVCLVLEAGRRVIGPVLPAVAIFFLIYQFYGKSLPGLLRHQGIGLDRFMDMQILSPNGVYGIPLGVSTTAVFYFILFAAFLEISGGGKFFVDMAFRLTSKLRGGPAKAAIVGSSIMGTINGSAVANVVGTGIFTIPLMKRAGYPGVFAGAVEAVSSTGGQIMPPIMGAAAFVMAEMLGMPYPQVAIAAIGPAIAYYLAVFIMVDLKAKVERLKPVDFFDMPKLAEEIKARIHLMIPLVLVVVMLFSGYTLMLSAFVGTVSIIPVGMIRRQTRLSIQDIILALETGARKAVVVAIPCAVAGIIVGVVTYSGLGLKFSSLIINASGGNVIVALLLVMVGCIIMGMGMPTTAAYIMGAVLMAPALVKLGVPPLAAHMFVFYFACLSMVTPPVALAAYAAAGISETDSMQTGIQSFLLALAGFLVPFAFVFNTSLLLQGKRLQILWVLSFTSVGVYALAKAVIGYKLRRYFWFRVAYFIAAILLIAPDHITDLIGIAVLALILVIQNRLESKSSFKNLPT